MKKMFGSLARYALVGSALAALTVTNVAARDFTVVAWGGEVQDLQRELWFAPFAKSKGIGFLEDTYLGGWAQFKAMQDSGSIPWDVVQVETSEMVRGCEEGVFVTLDWSKIGPKSAFLEDAVSDCGVGTIVWSVVIAYNADRVSKAPTRAADFWDTKTWPGKRGMRKGPKLNLELALMADGVPPAEVYETLRTSEGLERAFAKLDRIKPLVQWWEAGAQAPEWLAAGDVELSVAYNGRITLAQENGKNLQMIWDNTIYAIDSWVILDGTEHTKLGYEFIKFASQPALQAKYTETFSNGPTVKEALPLVRPERAANLPAGDNLSTGLFGGSEDALDFWVDNQEELTEHWNVWVAK